MNLLNKNSRSEKTDADPQWKNLYRIGGIAAVVAALLAIAEVIIEGSGSSLTSAPSTITELFNLLQSNRLLGLGVLGIFESVFFILTAIMFISLYPALRKTSQTSMVIAVVLILTGTIAYLATNPAIALDSLSTQYAAATCDSQRAILLSAGQAVLAMGQGTGATLTFLLAAIAGLLVSIVMWRSKTFSKPIAIIGIIATVFSLPGSALGLVVWTISGLMMLVWTVLIGRRLLLIANNVNSLGGGESSELGK